MNVLSHVKVFAREINPSGELLHIDHHPEPGAEVGMCFRNVAQKIKHDGGSAVLGWMFDSYKGFLDAVHHCIWRNLSGELVDITPLGAKSVSVVANGKIVYLPDSLATLVKPAGLGLSFSRPNRLFVYSNKANIRLISALLQEEREWEEALRHNPLRVPTRPLPLDLAEYLDSPTD